MRNGFFKGHGLGNDYIAVDPKLLDFRLTPKAIRAVCDRNWGVGSDGILAIAPSKRADFGLRIYNPDGSEAEKSGNGLRIFGRYLYATRRTRKKRFSVETAGGLVEIALHIDGAGDPSEATVEMGRATFRPAALPCRLKMDELVEAPIDVGGKTLRFNGVSVGNPHCILFRDKGQEWTRGGASLSGAGAGKPSPVSKTHQRPARRPGWPEIHLHPDLGAGRGRDPGLWIVLVRRRQRRRQAGPGGSPG